MGKINGSPHRRRGVGSFSMLPSQESLPRFGGGRGVGFLSSNKNKKCPKF